MHALYFLSAAIIVLSSLFSGVAGKPSSARAVGIQKYTRPHSLGENYVFDQRDGWEAVNVTDLQYKYEHSRERRSNRGQVSSKGKMGLTEGVHGLLGLMKGVGSWTRVTTTWYTGNDLRNPSCWQNGKWAPTDGSFACALTLEGWINRPKCFTFIELCNSPKKCIFVRVVDSCAGCPQGSKHVDLTKSAFSSLASLQEGRLDNVNMRPATYPEEWYEELWGPKHY